MNGMCIHCRARPGNRRRGLCYRCYITPSIRTQYKPLINPGGRCRRDRPTCWACGKPSLIARYLQKHGWYIRPSGAAGNRFFEVYCPECFAEWGWPDWESFDREHPDNAALQVPR